MPQLDIDNSEWLWDGFGERTYNLTWVLPGYTEQSNLLYEVNLDEYDNTKTSDDTIMANIYRKGFAKAIQASMTESLENGIKTVKASFKAPSSATIKWHYFPKPDLEAPVRYFV